VSADDVALIPDSSKNLKLEMKKIMVVRRAALEK
jgi:hypothetical protein